MAGNVHCSTQIGTKRRTRRPTFFPTPTMSRNIPEEAIDRIITAVGPVDEEEVPFDVRDAAEKLVREKQNETHYMALRGGIEHLIHQAVRENTFAWLARERGDPQAKVIVRLLQEVSREADRGNIPSENVIAL